MSLGGATSHSVIWRHFPNTPRAVARAAHTESVISAKRTSNPVAAVVPMTTWRSRSLQRVDALAKRLSQAG